MKRKPTRAEVIRTLDYYLSIGAITPTQHAHMMTYLPKH